MKKNNVSGKKVPRYSTHFAVFTSGGAGWALTNVSVYLASGIALEGYTVDMVTLHTSKEELMNFYGGVNGFPRVNVYSLGVKHARTCIPALMRYYRVKKPHIMFSQLTNMNAPAVIAKRLCFSDTINILLEGTLISKLSSIDSKVNPKLKLFPWIVRVTYPLADGLVAKSQDVLLDLGEVIGRKFENINRTVLPNPYDIGRFRSLAKENIKYQWLADKEIPVVISMGRLSEEKGFDILLKAFSEVLSEMPCRLIILGEGPKRESLETLAINLKIDDAVHMPGWVANPWKYLWRACMFVLSSRWEGWPSAGMEAMACGLPVIVTDCPGGAKEMIESGKSGIIIPTDNIKALKHAILDILRNPAYGERLSAYAYRSSLNYDYKVIAPRYVDFAKSLAKVATSK